MVHITHDGKLVWSENPHRSWNSTTAYFRNKAFARFGGVLSEEITTMRSRSAYKDPKTYSGPAYRATIKAPYFSCFDAISDLRGYAFKNELDGFSINADYTVPQSIFSRIRAALSPRHVVLTCEIPLPESSDVIAVNWWIVNKPVSRNRRTIVHFPRSQN